jgi:hypothetical protein
MAEDAFDRCLSEINKAYLRAKACGDKLREGFFVLTGFTRVGILASKQEINTEWSRV